MSNPIFFVADFNVEVLARQIANTTIPGVETRVAPFGAVMPTLAAGSPGHDWMAVVWTRPDAISAAFQSAAGFGECDTHKAIDEVRALAEAIARFARDTRATFVPNWILPPSFRGYGPLDWRPGLGVSQLLARMNIALADALAGAPNVFVLETARWIATTGSRGWSDKMWFASKSPFAIAVVEQAAADIAAAVDALHGRSRRVVILDLDDLLWGGLVGEVGWQGLNLGGHDVAGEAHVEFQRALKALTRRGIQLAIVSKNDEAVALDAIDHHPEMQLRRDDFAGWRINWRDKAENVESLLAEIGLGAESAVFIDDSPIERARVAGAVPGVLVPEWPADPASFRTALSSLRCFDVSSVTNEDRHRTSMYAVERTRRETRSAAGDLDAWLRSLEVVVDVERLNEGNLERASQLFNKTNQMNLATRRLSSSELIAWASDPDHVVLTFRVSDRFGDSGLTGLIGLAFEDGHARLVDFLMSCRVMSRNVERMMVHVAVAHARARGASELSADFQATGRNAPCLEFFHQSGLRGDANNRFTWDVREPYDAPNCVTLRDRTHASPDSR